jgi:glycosyltransferase involved in cell wall biosynthesis
MFKNKSIGVVVPAYNEEKLVSNVILTMPDFVDKIIVVNDASKDTTELIVRELMKKNKKIILINHKQNQGLGKSLIDGYLKARGLKLDITAVMAGDAQMDPSDLSKVIRPIVEKKADYVKGNRLLRPGVYKIMPFYRFLGNSFLTLLTKFATGYWHLIDPQCGYTAISKNALKSIDIQKMTKRYGYNAHILNMLNLSNYKVRDVEVKPVYGLAKSRIKLRTYIPKISFLLLKLYLRRIFHKYLVREFHPLVLFYLLSLVCIVLISVPLGLRFLYVFFITERVSSDTTLIIFTLSTMMGFLSFFFGMWMDMEDNKTLKP